MYYKKDIDYKVLIDQGLCKDENVAKKWSERFINQLPILDLSTDHIRKPIALSSGPRKLILPQSLCNQLQIFADQNNTSLYTVILATFQILIYRYTGQPTFFIASKTGSLPQARNDFYIYEADFSNSSSFVDYVTYVDDVTQNSADQRLSFIQKIAEIMGSQDNECQELSRIQFEVYTDDTDAGGRTDNAYDLRLVVVPNGHTFQINIEYSTGIYSADTVARMAEHLQTLLQSGLMDPDESIDKLNLLAERERVQLLDEWNETAADYPQDRTLHELIEAQAKRTPNAVAVVCNGHKLTYQELDAKANQLAHHLISLGIEQEELVGICMDRSIEMVVSLLGILKAGGAYVPLDPTYPTERITFILEDAKIQLLVTDQKNGAKYSGYVKNSTFMDRDQEELAQYSPENPQREVNAQNLAYTIYTSGSTGHPKGVSLQHQSVVNFLYSMGQAPGLTEDDTVLAVTTISFDIAGLELYLPLIKGAKIVLASSQIAADGQQLISLMNMVKPTIMQATPATWRLLLLSGWQGMAGLKILCGGEALSRDLAEKLMSCGSSVWNLYGPTETTIWSTIYQVTNSAIEDGTNRSISIGRPIANTSIYIVDQHNQPVPVGVPGSLLIGGDGLAREYINRPDLTTERFIPNPFETDPQSRLYHTGDLARYRADGSIEFLGREDHQVKLRGFRIELGEIEAVLNRHPAVEQAVVALKDSIATDTSSHEEAHKYLVAYIKPDAREVMPILEQQLHRLPNQLPLSVINKLEADHLYELIFDHLVYMKHDIQLADDACILDIGANIGLSMLFFHQHAPNGKIYAFEPVPEIFDVLKENIDIYEDIDGIPLMYGLSSQPGSVEFAYYPNWSALSGLYGDTEEEEELSRVFMQNHYGDLATYAEDWLHGRFEGQTVHCELRTISQVIQEYQIDKIDLIKINVEKSEFDILLGIEEDDWAKIDQLVIEVHKGEGRMTNIEALLQKQGYEIAIEQNSALKDTVLHMIYAWRPKLIPSTQSHQLDKIHLAKEPLQPSELYEMAKTYLPEYMLPSGFVLLPEVPLTPNGKVDRNALPDSDPGNMWVRSSTPFVAAEEETEQTIANIWQDVLQRSQVGVLDKFFELGGNSLLAAQVHQRLSQQVPAFTMSMIEMFQYPTIRSLTDYLNQDGQDQSSQDAGQQRAEKRKARSQQRRKQRA